MAQRTCSPRNGQVRDACWRTASGGHRQSRRPTAGDGRWTKAGIRTRRQARGCEAHCPIKSARSSNIHGVASTASCNNSLNGRVGANGKIRLLTQLDDACQRRYTRVVQDKHHVVARRRNVAIGRSGDSQSSVRRCDGVVDQLTGGIDQRSNDWVRTHCGGRISTGCAEGNIVSVLQTGDGSGKGRVGIAVDASCVVGRRAELSRGDG